MSNMRMKHKLIMSMMAGMIIIPGSVVRTQAAETDDSEKSLVPVTGIENILEASYQTEIKNNINLYLVPTEEGEYLNIAFSNTGDYTYIRSEADENSEWVGKLYSDSAAVVLEYLDGWTKIRSGNAEGYVPTETLFTGEEARSRSDEYTNENVTVTADCLNVREGHGTDTTVLTQIGQGEEYLVTADPVEGWYPIQVGEVNGWVCGDYVTEESSYSYGETKEEEQKRMEAEEAAVAKAEAEEAAVAKAEAEAQAAEAAAQSVASGQEVIDYACQFIGNPYVWGGTSLTDGADCSGFVQSVYAHFGISLPRTSYEQRSAGYEVSYEDAQPGDLILYEGHVGLYIGNDQIVNAMNEDQGIGISSATYTNIVAVRRIY